MSDVIVIRAEPAQTATVKLCDAAGLPVFASTMFAIEPVAWQAPDQRSIDGLLIGSANAIRQGGEELRKLGHFSVYCVGEATARAVRKAGFNVAMAGKGGLQNLLDELAGQSLNLLRLAGEKHVELTAPAGVFLKTEVIYRSHSLPMSDALAEKLGEGAITLLHSAEAASHFSEQCDARALNRSIIDIVLIGPRLEQAVGTGWRSVGWPDKPDDAALVAFAKALWQNRS